MALGLVAILLFILPKTPPVQRLVYPHSLEEISVLSTNLNSNTRRSQHKHYERFYLCQFNIFEYGHGLILSNRMMNTSACPTVIQNILLSLVGNFKTAKDKELTTLGVLCNTSLRRQSLSHKVPISFLQTEQTICKTLCSNRMNQPSLLQDRWE